MDQISVVDSEAFRNWVSMWTTKDVLHVLDALSKAGWSGVFNADLVDGAINFETLSGREPAIVGCRIAGTHIYSNGQRVDFGG